jgi:dihydroorotate dehydrogenase
MLYKKTIRPLLYKLDPEFAHEASINALSYLQNFIYRNQSNDDTVLACEIAGIKFPNKIGLAAGMDKACTCPLAWQGLGFGFAEIGTVTFHAQPGNPKPRLFRLVKEESLLNRLGFNNPGAKEVAQRLSKLRDSQKLFIPLGINIGKSKIVDPHETELVIEDYLACLSLLEQYGDYITINVSSPNTPGLREWQSPKQLSELLAPIRKATLKPVFLKISPDLSEEALDQIIEVASSLQINGLIATNTTISREGSPSWAQNEAGGVSGQLLKQKSLAITKAILSKKPKSLHLISVGGINCIDDVKQRLDLGVDLIQIYSALVYEGPNFVNNLNRRLVEGKEQ